MDTTARSRTFLRETLVFAGFAALTVLMTWPWAAHLRDAAPNAGDPYLNSWILWWDFHGTFHQPLHLFDANIFYPDRLSLAFSEHNYGLALPLFPLFAAGLRPLTAHGIATLLGFALCGYGAFRLARTLTGSWGAGWVAGIGFAFVPYRFHQLSHVNYLAAGWMPLLAEALVLHLRQRTRRLAAWLGIAFTVNALCCIHWMVLTLVPLTLAGVWLWQRDDRRDLRSLVPAAAALAVSGLLLAPFLLPYARAASLYGFVRSEDEVARFSATLVHWLTVNPQNRFWRGLGLAPAPDELCLFPGLLLLLLPLTALLLAERAARPPVPEGRAAPPALLRALDAVSILAGTVALLAASPRPFLRLSISGHELFRATDPGRALALLAAALLVRWWLAWPRAFFWCRASSLRDALANGRTPDAVIVGLVFSVTGFLGSFGVHTPFHTALWKTVFLFRSIRVPARWAMVADCGLALLAGYGALRIADALSRRVPRAATFGVLGVGMLVEMRTAPLDLIRGAVDPDAITRRLAATPMRGGLVELPAGGARGNYEWVLRAADHGKPLVDGVSGFETPTAARVRELSHQVPVPDALLDLFESIPVSYVTVHEGWMDPAERGAVRGFLARGAAAGRLRFVARFAPRDELWAVVRTEPGARPETPLSWRPDTSAATPATEREDPSLLGSVDDPPEAARIRGPLLVRGWARMPGEDLRVTVLLDGEERAPLSFSRVPRADVGAALPQMADVSTAGYEARFAFRPGDEGAHEVVVVFHARDGRARHYAVRRFDWSAR